MVKDAKSLLLLISLITATECRQLHESKTAVCLAIVPFSPSLTDGLRGFNQVEVSS
jgi:hypothetical protein